MTIAIDDLIHEQGRVSGEPFPLDHTSWAIHGFIPVDGDVILAKFDTQHEARVAITVLRQLDRS